MKRSRFTEEQIIGILREQEAGMKTADVCRKHGISEATFYKYKAKFGGMDVSDARKLKALEDKNAKLKKLLAEAMLTCCGQIPPKLIRVRPMKGRTHETSAIYRRADYRRVLREHEAGAKTADLARKHGVSEATLYNWKAKFGGMDVSEAKRLKQLEAENAKLKKLLAEQMLDAAALRELLSKKW